MAGTVRNRNRSRSRSRRSARSTQSRRRKIVGGMNFKQLVFLSLLALSGQIHARGVNEDIKDTKILETIKKATGVTRARIVGDDVYITVPSERREFLLKLNAREHKFFIGPKGKVGIKTEKEL